MSLSDQSVKCSYLKKSILTFCFGIVIGSLGSLLWQELLLPENFMRNHIITKEDIQTLRYETDEKLLKYIEGKWRSPIGDLIVNINDSDINGSFVVMESVHTKPKRQERYRVVSLEKVDGLFGIVKLSVCSERIINCNDDENIKIQINKIFGMKDTISISYDDRFSFCLEQTDCTRAFKHID